jgi:FkbM family methyltransferase
MKLLEIKSEYYSNKIIKKNYIQKIYKKYHSSLFEYSDLLHQTDINKIEITDRGLSAVSKAYGIKVFFPRDDQRSAPLESLNFGSYEEKELQVILQIISKHRNFLDIGANIGWYSLIIAKFYKKLKVHSFEPIKKTYEFLLKNIKCNFLSNVKAYNFGFYNKNKKITFYTYPEGTGNSSIKNLSQRKSIQIAKCNVKVLDDFITKKKIKVDFIKCDVEGAELFVFLGGKKTLLKDKPIVFCEMLRKWSKKFKYHPNEIILLFKRFNYRCFYVSSMSNTNSLEKWGGGQEGFAYKKFKLNEIKKINDKTKQTNFFFFHNVKHLKIIENFCS